MGILTNRFGWNSRPSAWQALQQQRERNKAMRADFEAANATASNMLNTMMSSQITGAGDLAAKRALARIQAETAAKLKENQAEASADSVQIWKNKPPPKQLTVGDMKIDLASGTVTTSDGTMLDIKTGAHKVNIKF